MILGTRTLSEIMCERESIALQAQEVLDEGTDPWGIKVERVEVKDIRLPQNLTRAMAREVIFEQFFVTKVFLICKQ